MVFQVVERVQDFHLHPQVVGSGLLLVSGFLFQGVLAAVNPSWKIGKHLGMVPISKCPSATVINAVVPSLYK